MALRLLSFKIRSIPFGWKFGGCPRTISSLLERPRTCVLSPGGIPRPFPSLASDLDLLLRRSCLTSCCCHAGVRFWCSHLARCCVALVLWVPVPSIGWCRSVVIFYSCRSLLCIVCLCLGGEVGGHPLCCCMSIAVSHSRSWKGAY